MTTAPSPTSAPDPTTPVPRRIRAALHISLDGVVESPERWTSAFFVPEMGQAVNDSFATTDTLLMGHRLYTEWAAHWPQQAGPMADVMNSIAKHVVSHQQLDLSWSGTTQLDPGDPAGDLRQRRQEPGRDITVSGSPTVVRWLLSEGLLDELRLFQYPVVLGAGRQLFPPGTPPATLDVVTATTYASGVVDLTYRPVPATGADVSPGAGRS